MKTVKLLLLIITLPVIPSFAEVNFKFHYTDTPGTGLNAPANAWAKEAVEKAGKIIGSSLLHNATINIEVVANLKSIKTAHGDSGSLAEFRGHNFMEAIFHGANNPTDIYGPLRINLDLRMIGWVEQNSNDFGFSLVETIIHELTHGLGFGSPPKGAFVNPLAPYISCTGKSNCFFNNFYTSQLPPFTFFAPECRNENDLCSHLDIPNEHTIIDAMSLNLYSHLDHWDKFTASILADIGYCLKTNFITTKECLFTKREIIPSVMVCFEDNTQSKHPFKIALFDEGPAPIFVDLTKKGSESETWNSVHIMSGNSPKDLELVLYWQGAEKRIPLKEGIYSLGAENLMNAPINNIFEDMLGIFTDIGIFIEENKKGKFTIRFEEQRRHGISKWINSFVQDPVCEHSVSISSFNNQEELNSRRNVYAYRQIIRVDHDVAFSLVVKDNEHLYFQETIPTSKLNKQYFIRPNAHLIGMATPQSKILLKLNDANVVAEFSLLPSTHQQTKVQTQDGKEFQVDFQVIDKYFESKIPEYFLLVDITPL